MKLDLASGAYLSENEKIYTWEFSKGDGTPDTERNDEPYRALKSALQDRPKNLKNRNEVPNKNLQNALERAKAGKNNKVPVIIHIDAHPDICDVYHDSKYSHACPNFRAIEYGYEDKNVTMIGIRGFEAQEIETFKKHPEIDVFKAIDVKKMGVEALLTLIVSKYKDPKYEVYLSYDIDANDPAYAPGTGTPEAFGLSNFETMAIVTGLISNLNITCMDLVEIAPPLDVNNITSWLGLKTIYEIFNALIKTNRLSK